MKKIILIILVFIVVVIFYVSTSFTNRDTSLHQNAIMLVGENDTNSNQRFSDTITTTNGITFKCSLNYVLDINKEDGSILFTLKDQLDYRKSVVISCDKKLVKVDYYSYDDQRIYSQTNIDREWINIDTDYCKKDCSYAIIFVKYKDQLFYAKFKRI